jgi:hypothetical protein
MHQGGIRLVRPIIVLLLVCLFAHLVWAAASAYWPPVYSENKDTTLLLRIETAAGDAGYGSGILVSDDGRALTARHVLPSDQVLNSGQYRITGLVGWDAPSVDFNQASELSVDYMSKSLDFAVLKFKIPPPNIRVPCPDTTILPTEPVLLMAYPNGGNLVPTDGIASGLAPGGLYRSNLASGRGESGGPIFNAKGSLIGIHLSGTRRTADGELDLAYFLTTGTVIGDLATNFPSLTLRCGPPNTAPTSRPREFDFAYVIDATKDDQPGATSTRPPYTRSFPAQDGYRIVNARFVAASANHVSEGPTYQIAEGGRRVNVSLTLESGRGWWTGRIVTHQAAAL